MINNRYLIDGKVHKNTKHKKRKKHKDKINAKNKKVTTSTINININIKKLNLKETIFLVNSGFSIDIHGCYKLECIKLSDTKGSLKLDYDIDLHNYEISGTITIFNFDNSTLYSGIIYSKLNSIKYIISNRPLIPVGICMKGIINIDMHVYKKINNI